MAKKRRSRLEERIQNGIKYLDTRIDSDWPLQIDLPTLDLISPRFCVLGQLYGTYLEGVEKIGLEIRGGHIIAEALGFVGTPFSPKPKYSLLTSAWKRAIRELKRERRGFYSGSNYHR